MMTTTCRALSIFLLSSITCFAIPKHSTTNAVNTAAKNAVVEHQSESSSPAPLLGCMGTGMALGGLICVRWANRGDK